MPLQKEFNNLLYVKHVELPLFALIVGTGKI